MQDEHDIKAPDGYLLGGRRRVRKDGTILFQRGWWALPDDVKADFIGHDVWVHINNLSQPGTNDGDEVLDVAYPGLHIYEALGMRPPRVSIARRTNRPDAKPAYRRADHKDWAERCRTLDQTI